MLQHRTSLAKSENELNKENNFTPSLKLNERPSTPYKRVECKWDEAHAGHHPYQSFQLLAELLDGSINGGDKIRGSIFHDLR